MALGPVIGGVLTEGLGWRWVFYVNLPFGALVLIAALRGVRESRDRARGDYIDVPGAVAVTAGLLALVVALQEAQTEGWVAAPVLGLLAAAVVALAGFVTIERRARRPLVDFALFRIPAYSGAVAVSFLSFYVLSALIFFGTLYLQKVLGQSPTAAGLMFLPLTLMYLGAGPLSGRLSARLGARIPLIAGTVALVAAMVLFSRAGPTTTAGVLAPMFVIAGLGLGTTYTLTSSTAMAAVAPAQAGAASGILSMSRMAGAVFGVAVTHSLFESIDERRLHTLLALVTGEPGGAREAAREAFAAAFEGSMLLCAAVACAAVLAAVLLTSRSAPVVAAGPGR
jgi:MFS family permease